MASCTTSATVRTVDKTHTIPETASQTSTSFGQRIIRVGTSIAHNMPQILRIGGYTLLALAIISSAIFLPVVYAMPPRTIKINPETPQLTTEKAYNTSLQRFNPQIVKYMNPGFMLVNNGTMACQIDRHIESDASCQQKLDAYFTRHPDNLDPASIAIESDRRDSVRVYKTNFLYRGTPYALPDKNTTIKAHVDPQKMANYNNALHFVEREILSRPAPFTGSTNNTIGILKKMHRLLASNLTYAKYITPGKYRTTGASLFRERTKIFHPTLTPEESDKEVDPFSAPEGELGINMWLHERAEKELTESELEVFANGFNKYFNERSFSQFTQEEREIWSRFIDIPPSHQDIPKELATFARTLKSMLQQERSDAIEIASFVHTEIERIQPFKKFNGQLGRLLMDTILEHRMGDTVIFPDYQEYNAKVKESVRTPESRQLFTRYLKEVIFPWNMAQKEKLDPQTASSRAE